MSIVPSSFDITTMASLIDLFPYDVILSVFMFMNLKSLIICREVCRGFKDLIDADLRLQYHIALDAAGMENGPPSWMDIKERKDRLQSYVSRWQGFVWQQGTLLPPLPGPILHWVIDSGVIGRFYDAGNGVYGMHFSRLPARSRNIIQKGWQIGNIGHNATAFCLDPSQDLLVVAEVIPAG
ncbi:hypothetical protein GLOTRDRAFT_133091 [Gloeophyllum trabeum ATCC 11539]|uniref:F-box domain-containing protein n=1 Tax=Gloeophyllum trabeum (strain ATCC 11539 / FP-39264 / Madison 617) TaxID=670483 RepID=S7RAB8_GLOTA|nr:uncharacterized protein GLOTRDRAFT_133091 [Gloeophyllum trabeum ATCC 11539]EPQ51210.1 hypothetical protein GLOTRDRAFT_133091 [Gloeophyllum trabeum ATCC 11539]